MKDERLERARLASTIIKEKTTFVVEKKFFITENKKTKSDDYVGSMRRLQINIFESVNFRRIAA